MFDLTGPTGDSPSDSPQPQPEKFISRRPSSPTWVIPLSTGSGRIHSPISVISDSSPVGGDTSTEETTLAQPRTPPPAPPAAPPAKRPKLRRGEIPSQATRARWTTEEIPAPPHRSAAPPPPASAPAPEPTHPTRPKLRRGEIPSQAARAKWRAQEASTSHPRPASTPPTASTPAPTPHLPERRTPPDERFEETRGHGDWFPDWDEATFRHHIAVHAATGQKPFETFRSHITPRNRPAANPTTRPTADHQPAQTTEVDDIPSLTPVEWECADEVEKGDEVTSEEGTINNYPYRPLMDDERGVLEQPRHPDMRTSAEHPEGRRLRTARVMGSDNATIIESTIPGAGAGLFAIRDLPPLTTIAAYRGRRFSEPALSTSDCVADLGPGHGYIDGDRATSLAPWANDPRNDLLINARLVFLPELGKAVIQVLPDVTIVYGQEIFISYGAPYWLHHMHLLSTEDQAYTEAELPGQRVPRIMNSLANPPFYPHVPK